MTADKNRVRLALEQMEDRCTPSTLGGGLAAPFPALKGGPQAAVARVRAPNGLAVPIRLAFRCSGDVITKNTSATGFATLLGHWTGQGQFDSTHVDQAADQAEVRGTLTVVTAKGDKLFVSFTSSWQLSTGKGKESITVTGGTGRFAGASGRASLDCTVTADPASPSTFRCKCKGTGTLILARR